MEPIELLRALDACCSRALQQGLGKECLNFPPTWGEGQDAEMAAICERLKRFLDMVDEAYRYAEAMANGDLDAEVSRTNIFAMPLKALNANLRHLTWQAHQIAAGDLNQQVHFLGEFSRSFNHMIDSLREKQMIEQRLTTITDVVGEGVCLVDAQGCLIFMNPEAQRLLGYSFTDCAGTAFHQLVCKQNNDAGPVFKDEGLLAKAILNGREYRNNDTVFTCKSGLLMPVSVVCRPIIKDGVANGAVIAFHDITDQKNHQESLKKINAMLEKQATTDPLTGIYNRLKLTELLEFEIDRAKRYKSQLSVALFDVDHFKKINDTFGHLKGDEVLKELVSLVAANIRCTDFFARWGGEEFIIVASDCSLKKTVSLAEKLRVLVAEHDFPISQPVTISLGVTTWREDDTGTTLTGRADKTMYTAKHRGRNRVESCS